MGVSRVPFNFRGPNNEDYSILGSILGSPYFGKLPYIYIYRVGNIVPPTSWLKLSSLKTTQIVEVEVIFTFLV